MEETNYPSLCQSRRNAIANSIHATIEEFSSHLPQEKESLFLFYASLGMDLCTKVYREVFQNQEIHYALQCGKLSVRVSPDPNMSGQGLNFGANGVSLEEGNFHCWVVGHWKAAQLIQPYTFIDFTSRFYKENFIKQGFEWKREDIGNYIWIEGQDKLAQTGISVDVDEPATRKALRDWSDNLLGIEMLKNAVQAYQKLI
jgi:hypothetical protein